MERSARTVGVLHRRSCTRGENARLAANYSRIAGEPFPRVTEKYDVTPLSTQLLAHSSPTSARNYLVPRYKRHLYGAKSRGARMRYFTPLTLGAELDSTPG